MGFKFMPTEKEVEVEGHTFTIRVGDAETVDSLSSLDDLNESLRGKTLVERCKAFRDSIETILGKGSCEKIFKGRRLNIIDCTSLMQYLLGQVNQLTEEQNKAILGEIKDPITVKTTIEDARLGPDDTVQ
jgi:hypothetical protein